MDRGSKLRRAASAIEFAPEGSTMRAAVFVCVLALGAAAAPAQHDHPGPASDAAWKSATARLHIKDL